METRSLSCRLGGTEILADLDVAIGSGEIHALLGPNGAGKTTLMRILAGLVEPTSGEAKVLGRHPADLASRAHTGWVPPGDRSFYLRLSGLENLIFFARLHGISRREARRRAESLLDELDLARARRTRVASYSQGMKKRLSVARALLSEPAVLLLDEATHDLDPEGATCVRAMTRRAAAQGTAVVWATQRLDEIRGFADSVTVLARGRARFSGSVRGLVAHAGARRYVMRLGNALSTPDEPAIARALGERGWVSAEPFLEPGERLIQLWEDVVLGDAIAALAAAGIDVLACREERSEVEEAFVKLTTALSGSLT